MDEGLNRRSSDRRFQDVSDDGVNLLLSERVPYSPDKVSNGRHKEAVFLDENGRMPTGTIASTFPSKSFDIWYFLRFKEEKVQKMFEKVTTYHQNCWKHWPQFETYPFGCDGSLKKGLIDDDGLNNNTRWLRTSLYHQN